MPFLPRGRFGAVPIPRPCDGPELCTGSSAACPGDGKLAGQCRAAVDLCDAAEVCDGVANDCPADAYEPPTTVCRANASTCDVPERCTGSSPVCPSDVYEPAGMPCNDGNACSQGDECDGAGICTGDAIEPCELPALSLWSQLLVGLFILASGLGLVSQRKHRER